MFMHQPASSERLETKEKYNHAHAHTHCTLTTHNCKHKEKLKTNITAIDITPTSADLESTTTNGYRTPAVEDVC